MEPDIRWGVPATRAILMIPGPTDLPWPDIAFLTTTWALRDWLELRHPEVGWPDVLRGV